MFSGGSEKELKNQLKRLSTGGITNFDFLYQGAIQYELIHEGGKTKNYQSYHILRLIQQLVSNPQVIMLHHLSMFLEDVVL